LLKREYIMKHATAFAAAFMLAASASFTMTTSGNAHGMRDSIADRLEDREALRDLLADRIAGREDLGDRRTSVSERRAALRDLILERHPVLGDRFKDRESLRDLREHILNKLERRAELRELLMDRLERGKEFRRHLLDRLERRQDLEDLIMDRLERRAALRDRIADRLGSREDYDRPEDYGRAYDRGYEGYEGGYDEEPMLDREDVRDIILDRIQSSGGLSQVLNQLRDRVNENQ
jgi:hypothetical protein